MPVQSRARWLRFVALTIAIFALSPTRALVAQTTRQVAVESLIYDLKNPDAVRRQTAAKDLGVAKARVATSDLVALAHDPAPAVRRAVELALERMDDSQAMPGFIAFASDMENDIRARAVSSLVGMHISRVSGIGAVLTKLGELITFTPERDLDIVVEPDVPVDPVVVETLRARLVDTERGIRRTAIRGLGILRARAAVPDLLQVAREDRDNELRFDAVRSLRKIDDRSIAPELVALLNMNGNEVRHELMATLGSMRFRGAVPELTRIVEQAPKTDAPRILALSALADIGDPASMPLFETLKADKNELMRLYANEG